MFHTKEKPNTIQIAILATIIFNVVAHGYRFSNNMYSYDSLLTIVQNDYGWQIALGRYLIPAFVFLRGNLCSPWLITMLAIICNIITVCLICRILEIKNPVCAVLVSGICVCNPTAISMNASYLQDVDLYALACTLAVLSVYLFQLFMDRVVLIHEKKNVLPLLGAILSLTVSMAIYQAYLCMALGLFMMLLLRATFQQEKIQIFLKRILGMGITLGAAAGLYYVGWKLLQKIFHIWTANTYNGLASVGDYSDHSFIASILESYRRVWVYFTDPYVFQTISMSGKSLSFLWKMILIFTNLVVLGIILFSIIKLSYKRFLTVLFRIMLLALFPFGINAVCFLSKGMEHDLMIYAFNLVYILALWLVDYQNKEPGTRRFHKQVAFILPFAVFIWVNIVSANQAYLKKELLDEAANSLLTRIVSDVEDLEGYQPAQTPVAIYGSFEMSPYIKQLPDFEEVICLGMGKTNLAYVDLDYSYLKYILNVDMNLTRVDTSQEELMQIIQAMPYYPQAGSVAYVGDTIVVKIAD